MRAITASVHPRLRGFPFLFGGTFIEGNQESQAQDPGAQFPFLFGGTFIEGFATSIPLSQRQTISLPFRRDFH